MALSAPVEEVWAALTRPDRLSVWFGADVDLELRVGGAVRFVWPDGRIRRGVVEAIAPPRRLVFRWHAIRGGGEARPAATRVELILDPDGGETTLTVVEAPLALPGVVSGASPEETGYRPLLTTGAR
jgi:uncharacterized protein YndB with AHSA1/START domain